MPQTNAAPPPMPDFAAQRDIQRLAFLAAHGWQDEKILLSDKKALKFAYRLSRQNDQGKVETAILLDWPTPFTAHLHHLQQHHDTLYEKGLHPALILACNTVDGFALLEDLGENRFDHMLHAGVVAQPLLEAALKPLIHLHTHTHRSEQTQTQALEDLYLREAKYFIDWYWPALYGYEAPPDTAEEYRLAWQKTLQALPPIGQTLCLTQYKAATLFWRHDNNLLAQIGITKFAQAHLASPAYDVASLLYLPAIAFDATLTDQLQNIYCTQTGSLFPKETIEAHLAVFGCLHIMREMGQAVQQTVVTRDKSTLAQVPPLVNGLRHVLPQHSITQPLQKWFARHTERYTESLPPIRFFHE